MDTENWSKFVVSIYKCTVAHCEPFPFLEELISLFIRLMFVLLYCLHTISLKLVKYLSTSFYYCRSDWKLMTSYHCNSLQQADLPNKQCLGYVQAFYFPSRAAKKMRQDCYVVYSSKTPVRVKRTACSVALEWICDLVFNPFHVIF